MARVESAGLAGVEGQGYRLVDYRVRGDTKDFSGKVEYRFNGPQAFVGIGF